MNFATQKLYTKKKTINLTHLQTIRVFSGIRNKLFINEVTQIKPKNKNYTYTTYEEKSQYSQ